MLSFAIVLLLAGLSLGDAKWAYTAVATADGQPCLADCKAGLCIVDGSGNNKSCISSGVKPPIYRTSQLLDKTTDHCLSNCGIFGLSFESCYTTEEKQLDFCNSSPDDRSILMTKCEQPCMKEITNFCWFKNGPCRKVTADEYTCDVGNGKRELCAPGATTNEPNVDANKENLAIQKT